MGRAGGGRDSALNVACGSRAVKRRAFASLESRLLGREFTHELLQAIAPVDERTLEEGLAQLVDAELVYQRGLPPRSRYTFKHALIQDAAYQSMLKSTRQRYHQQIAKLLETRWRETVELQPELVAHHYTEAGLVTLAMPYWQRAGVQALERSAHLEAIGHLNRGLEVLQAMPDTPERKRYEIDLQVPLGSALVATKGYAAPEVEQVCVRARTLCEQVGQPAQLLVVLRGLGQFYMNRAQLEAARDLGEQRLRLADQLGDPAALRMAHGSLVSVLYHMGEFEPALAHFERALALPHVEASPPSRRRDAPGSSPSW